jgi:hypothetical protein
VTARGGGVKGREYFGRRRQPGFRGLAIPAALVADNRGKLTPAGQDRLRYGYADTAKSFSA